MEQRTVVRPTLAGHRVHLPRPQFRHLVRRRRRRVLWPVVAL